MRLVDQCGKWDTGQDVPLAGASQTTFGFLALKLQSLPTWLSLLGGQHLTGTHNQACWHHWEWKDQPASVGWDGNHPQAWGWFGADDCPSFSPTPEESEKE